MRIGLIAALAALTLAGCEQREDDAPAEMTLDEAREQGLLIHGFQDVEGIQRSVEAAVQDAEDRASGIQDLLESVEAGFDPATIRELGAINAFNNLAIERIEFVPGLAFSDGNQAGGPITDFGGIDGSVPGGAFAATFPSSSDLVSDFTIYTEFIFEGDEIDGFETVTKDEVGATREVHYYEGNEVWYHRTEYHDDGAVTTDTSRYTRDGQHVNTRVSVTDSRGRTSVTVNQDGDEPPTTQFETFEERDERQKREREEREADRAAREDTASDDTSTDDGDTGDTAPGDDGDGADTEGEPVEEGSEGGVDQYQPADGMEGSTFCPLTLDLCRREMEKLARQGEDILLGAILINPAEPDVMPEAPRLAFDTETLVINPDPTVTESDQVREPPQFQMRLPVWVLPPRPNT